MDRDQAERSLAIIRSVIENTRRSPLPQLGHDLDRALVHHFRGRSSGTWIDRRELPVYWYAAPLLGVTVLNIVVVLLFMSRKQGVQSYVEWQLWAIWIAFLVFTGVAIVTMYLAQIRPSLFALIFAMNCGICFTMMGIVFYRHFSRWAACFSRSRWWPRCVPDYQWWLIGATWWLAMFVPGLTAHREHLRRQHDEQRTRIL